MQKKWAVPVLLGTILLLMLFLAFTLNGTGESGDSITHYQFARYAFDHPWLFFDNWGKPLFTLLAAPFALFGFTGIKVFNVILTILSMSAAYLAAKKMNLENSWMVIVLLLIAPMNFALAFTGLTEPLFATLIIGGLCLLYCNKVTMGLIVLSFLPFARSEGMFMLIIIACWLVWQKKHTACLWLASGQLLYAIIGYFHFKDFLWFYHSNPYSLKSGYGHGRWTDYLGDLPVIINLTSTILLGLGCILVIFYGFIKRKQLRSDIPYTQLLLVWLLFIAYFSFHTIAWTFGLFASFGMTRIIVGVAPLMAIICLYGFNGIANLFGKWVNQQNFVRVFFICLVVFNIYYIGFSQKKFASTPGFAMNLTPDQEIENKLAVYMKQKYPDYKNHNVRYYAPYVGVAFDIDQFDLGKHDNAAPPANDDYVVWDQWFSVVEGGLQLETMQKDSSLVKDTTLTCKLGGVSDYSVVLFRRKTK